MKTAASIIAASQLFAVAFGAPLVKSRAAALMARRAYQVFGGDGTTAQGWPAENEWASFDDIWAANVDTMGKSCTQFGQENNSPGETAAIKTAIESVAKTSGVASHFLLTFMMQESKGCVRAPTTNYGVNNPGLMQSFNGKHSCNPDGKGVVPCPDDMIMGMISDGAGVGLEFGLSQAIKQSGASDVSKYYKGARIYNSGSIAASGNLGDGIATHCYASDIANRLLGWAGDSASGCDEATIGSIGGKGPSPGASKPKDDAPKDDAPKDDAPKQPTTTEGSGDNQDTPAQAPASSGGCSKTYNVQEGDTCASTGVDLATLMKLNPGLDKDCTNLMAGKEYCVAA